MGNPVEAALEEASRREQQQRAPVEQTSADGAYRMPSTSATYGALPVPTVTSDAPPHPFASEKFLCTAYILWFPLGLFGAHHFYLHRPGFGMIYLLTCGLFGVGWLVDAIRMRSLVSKANEDIQNPLGHPDPNLGDAYLLWFPLGLFGAHHFYLRRFGFGMLYLLSFGLFGIGWLIDACRMPRLVKKARDCTDRNYRTMDVYVLTACPITGLLGFQHYYLNRPGMGMVYTLTLGLFGIGWLVDLCRMPLLVRDAERRQKEGDDRRKRLDDAYLLWLPPVGLLGLHHYYLERPLWGCIYTFTLGLFGIGWLIDICRIPHIVKEFNKWLKNCRNAQDNYGPPVFQGAQFPPGSNSSTGVILSVPPMVEFSSAAPTPGAPTYLPAGAVPPSYQATSSLPPPYPGAPAKQEEGPVVQDPRKQNMRHQFV